MQETPFSLEQFELLFKEHFKSLALLAYSVVKDKDVARDMVQEFFVKFWETQHTTPLRGLFETYAARAVKNRSLNHIARQEVQDKYQQHFAAMSPEYPDTDHGDREQFYQRLSHAIDCMPEQRRRVFLMSAADNKKYAEIARELNISINTVKFHIKGAYVFLRNEAFTGNQPSPEWERLVANLEHSRPEELLSSEEATCFHIRDAAEGWQEIAALDTTAVWQEAAARIEHTHRKRYSINWFRVAAATVVTGLIAGGAVLLLKTPCHRSTTNVVLHAAGNKQQIQLITGSSDTVVLAADTQFKEADGTCITASKTSVSYQSAQTGHTPVFNTLVVPRGHTYKVVLADGTRIWLNADSRLRFPVTFSGDRRTLELQGEACFETTPMAARPFLVKAGDLNVTVLGTEFNINAYTNKTLITLVSGKVKVDAGALVKELSPGQQAVYGKGGMAVARVDADQFTAWKEDILIFDNESLGDIMIRVGREYDYSVSFENTAMQQQRLSGNLEKSPSVAQVLTLLEQMADVHFVEDQAKRTIMVKQHS